MYNKNKTTKTSININEGYEGETIEAKVERIVNNKEPIKDGAPLIYTERKDGVAPGHDIRTDRFEIAVEAMTQVTKSRLAKRENRLEALKGGKEEGTENKGNGEPESIQGKE